MGAGDQGAARVLGGVPPRLRPRPGVRRQGRQGHLRLQGHRGAAGRGGEPALQGRPVPDEEEQDRGRRGQGPAARPQHDRGRWAAAQGKESHRCDRLRSQVAARNRVRRSLHRLVRSRHSRRHGAGLDLHHRRGRGRRRVRDALQPARSQGHAAGGTRQARPPRGRGHL